MRDHPTAEYIRINSIAGFGSMPLTKVGLEYKNLRNQVTNSWGLVSSIFAKVSVEVMVGKACESGYRPIRMVYGENYPGSQRVNLREIVQDWVRGYYGEEVEEVEEEEESGADFFLDLLEQ